MESHTESHYASIGATIVRSAGTSPTSNRLLELGRLVDTLAMIKQRHVHEFQILEHIRCQVILYAAAMLFELWCLEQFKHSIVDGDRPRMSPVGYQQYANKVGFLIGQMRLTAACESRMRSICRGAWRRVCFWEQKCLERQDDWHASLASYLEVTQSEDHYFPETFGEVVDEFEIAQDMADKEDCAEYLARCGGKAVRDMTGVELSGRSFSAKYIVSRRMRDRYCLDEPMWFDETCEQRTPQDNSVRGREWWNERMQNGE